MRTKKLIIFLCTLVLSCIAVLLLQEYRGESSAVEVASSQGQEAPRSSASMEEEIESEPTEPVFAEPYRIIPQEVMEELTKEARYVGTDGNIRAGGYVMEQLQKIGLEPFRKETLRWSYLQEIDGRQTELFNVVGVLKGDNASTAVFVTSHFDSERDTPGALDNASGVTAMLTVADILQSNRQSLHGNMDVVFCSFNGEEQFYLGSAAFLEEFLAENAYAQLYNINLDCVGMVNGGDYMFGAAEHDIAQGLNRAFLPYLERNRLTVNDTVNGEVNSDHKSFLRRGIAAVTLSQENLYLVCHTREDNLSIIDYDGLDRVSRAVAEYIIELVV